MTAPFRIEPLAKSHDRRGFDCGVPPLNDYLARQAGQDVRRRVAACFVAVETATEALAGFYTLAAGGVSLPDLPEPIAKKLPRYPTVPIVRIGRLAVDRSFQGRRLGEALLADAVKRTLGSDVAAFAAVVDAKDDDAVRFYKRYGFQQLGTDPRTLFLPLDEGQRRLATGQRPH